MTAATTRMASGATTTTARAGRQEWLRERQQERRGRGGKNDDGRHNGDGGAARTVMEHLGENEGAFLGCLRPGRRAHGGERRVKWLPHPRPSLCHPRVGVWLGGRAGSLCALADAALHRRTARDASGLHLLAGLLTADLDRRCSRFSVRRADERQELRRLGRGERTAALSPRLGTMRHPVSPQAPCRRRSGGRVALHPSSLAPLRTLCRRRRHGRRRGGGRESFERRVDCRRGRH